MTLNFIAKASVIAGTQRKLAEKLKVSPEFVSQMKTGEKTIPARLCKPIERLTHGEVKAADLRPDIFSDNDTAA